MPLFDFLCEDCKEVFEVLAHKPEKHKCPKCGKETTRRLYTPIAYFKIRGYPNWVNRVGDYQKRQIERGEEPALPSPEQVL